jgi:PST family polysaccharide transporter
MASQRQAARATFWKTVEGGATQGISFIVVLLLARLLGPANYGLVALASAIALFGQILLGQTFSESLVQAKHLEPAHTTSLFWMLLGFGVLSCGVVLIAAGWLSQLFDLPALAPVLRALSPLLVLTALQAVPTALFKRDLDFRALAQASMGGSLLGGLVGVALAFAGFGAWALVANLLVQNSVVTMGIWRQSPFRPMLRFSLPHVRELWSYGQYTFLLRIAVFTTNQGPRILIGYLYGPAALGAFSLGLRIVENIFQLLTLPAANVLVPVIARIRDEPKRLERAVLGATVLTAASAIPAYLGLALIAPVAVPLAFGKHWAESATIVQILCLVGVSMSISQISRSIVAGLGRPQINLAISVTAAIVNVALVLATAHWGMVATSAALVVRSYIVLPTFPLIISRLTGIPLAARLGALGPVVLAAGVMAVCVEALLHGLADTLSPLELTLAAIAAGGASYALALYVFARPALRLGMSILSDLRPKQAPA